ncbi:MAG: hypothetical protein V3T17_19260 [Pseudomonadales bacterium]
MAITEIVFNSLWQAMHKSECDLLEKLETLDEESTDAQAVKATLDDLCIKKANLKKIAKDNSFSDEVAYSLKSEDI